MLRITNLFILFLLSIYSYQIQAANVIYRAGVLFGKYDNVNLANDPTTGEEFSQSLDLGLRVLEDSSSLYVNLDASFRSFNYKNDIAADRNNAQFLANVLWRIKPGRFDWVFTNNFTQTVIDPLASNSPGNRQNVNVLSTGPNYTMRLNPRNDVRLEARVENYSYQQYADNNRASTAIRWLHNVNTALILSLNNESELARFNEDTINLDFQRNDVFFGANYIKGQNALLAEYGVTSIKNEFIDDISSDRYLFSFTNSRTQTSSVQLVYENYLSNTGSQVLRLSPSEGDDLLPIDAVANDVFVNENYRIQYNKALTNGAIRLNLFTGTRRYELSDSLDYDADGAAVNIRWYLQSNSSFIFNAMYLLTDYLDTTINREDSDKILSAEYRYRIKRNVSVGLLASSLERISTVEERSYEDFRIFVSLSYFSL